MVYVLLANSACPLKLMGTRQALESGEVPRHRFAFTENVPRLALTEIVPDKLFKPITGWRCHVPVNTLRKDWFAVAFAAFCVLVALTFTAFRVALALASAAIRVAVALRIAVPLALAVAVLAALRVAVALLFAAFCVAVL